MSTNDTVYICVLKPLGQTFLRKQLKQITYYTDSGSLGKYMHNSSGKKFFYHLLWDTIKIRLLRILLLASQTTRCQKRQWSHIKVIIDDYSDWSRSGSIWRIWTVIFTPLHDSEEEPSIS